MKVKLTEDMKKVITIAEIPMVKKIIADMKEDTGLNDYAEMIARIVSGDNCSEVIQADAQIARNARAWDVYGEDSGNLDIIIHVLALNRYSTCTFYEIEAYLSDVWAYCSDDDRSYYLNRWYVAKYERK